MWIKPCIDLSCAENKISCLSSKAPLGIVHVMQPHAYVQLFRPQHCSELPVCSRVMTGLQWVVQYAQESRQNRREHERCLTSILHFQCHGLRMFFNRRNEGSNSWADGAKLPPQTQPCNTKSAAMKGGHIVVDRANSHLTGHM